MSRNSVALRLGSEIIMAKLASMMSAPGLSAIQSPAQTLQPSSGELADPAEEMAAELPTTVEQTRDRSAKINTPRIITTR
jgi:hypothetical protein